MKLLRISKICPQNSHCPDIGLYVHSVAKKCAVQITSYTSKKRWRPFDDFWMVNEKTLSGR